ncbi:ketopantoate reductase family protein [Nucisporomicrobium flavum]|uniref:ketopantoate reductase family protein n=1 Tax=Nucisporomicrobium flavum TaxID=2785915 RepID=UPI0018F406C1|nr:ketopantoate reductase family protein [Nucisporomicrobium flavum]
MRTLVVGAGATGGYFGGRLAEAGRDITFLVRARRAAELAERGLRIHAPAGESVVPARTVTADKLDRPYDVIVLAVKSYHLQQALADISPAIGTGTVIVPLLNGMRHIDTLVGHFGADHVYGGVCMIAGTLTDEGDVVQLTGLHRLLYGPLDGTRDDRLAAVAEALSGAEFESQPSTEIVQEMWEKWVFLAGLGVVTTLMRATVGDITAAPGGIAFASAVADEAIAIASAAGHPPREAAIGFLRASLTARDVPTTSSMYRDMAAGGPVEAEAIVGDLVTHAERHKVPAPLISAAWTNLSIYSAHR